MDRSRLRHGIAALLAIAGLLAGCQWFGDSQLERVKRAGELHVLTRNSPTTYYEGTEGPTGVEYELAKAFADSLGVKLRIEVVPQFADIVPRIARGQADLAAAGLTDTAQRRTQVRFGQPYQTIQQQVVIAGLTPAPATVRDLTGKRIAVVEGSSYAERLAKLRETHPALAWTLASNVETEELLEQVKDGELDATVADSNIVSLSRQLYPELKIAFNLSEPEPLAWAFPPGDDTSLIDAANTFLESWRRDGRLAALMHRHYGPLIRFNPVNIATFRERIGSTLPKYRKSFVVAGKATRFDWRLLAALAYQESYWEPDAKSPTGVRGMMMLTLTTAEHMGVKDRLDAEQSIRGGSQYLRQLIDALPDRIREPDRTWLALAAYNVGLSHLEDARIITQQQGGNPDRWNDVRKYLPLLSKQAWYSKTRYGYARGSEPVEFVARIQTYYEVLKKVENRDIVRKRSDALKLKAPAL